jgi:L-ascorbate metabolism protein UlaG (beta-lactamase superfamily)
MKIIWLGHGSFRIEIEDEILLLDPWINGNPVFSQKHREDALLGTTQILLTHGHFDHSNDVVALAKELNVSVAGIADLMSYWEKAEGLSTIGFNKGGTIKIGHVEVTMVNATHSSSLMVNDRLMYTGAEAGFVLKGEGKTIYFSGDTDVMADMEIIHELHKPEIGILSCGGHFTMDMKRAAYACKKYFKFKKVIPCHYKTFPILEQDATVLEKELGRDIVIEPEIMKPIEF